MAELVSTTYANTFLKLAQEEDKVDIYQNKAKILINAFENDNEFKLKIEHPDVLKEDKLKLLTEVLENDVSDSYAGLFNVVLSKNRESELYNILKTFVSKADELKGIVYAQVFTATVINEDRLNVIKQKLEQNLKKDVILEVIKDLSLIAGIKIMVDGHLIDGTVKKDIYELKKSLYSLELSQDKGVKHENGTKT